MATNTTQVGNNLRDAVPKTKYQLKQFDDTKYRVDSLSYPKDLMGNLINYGSNYVIFYVNLSEDSKMIKNKEIETVEIAENERIKKQINAQEYTGLQVAGTQLGVGAIAASTVGRAVGLQGPGLGVAAATAAGTAITAAQTSGGVNAKFSRPQKRLAAAIALHVPNQLSIRYGMGWAEEETFGMQAALAGGEEIVNAAGALGTGSVDKLKNSASQGGSILSAFALKNAPGGSTISALTGLAPNPKKEQIFTGVDFRSFTFDYDFAPRDGNEAQNVFNIIRAFKFHMHPEYKDDKSFLFIYPSEFDIVYHHGALENPYIHRHTSCALTELNVNYTPNGIFSTFSNGMPTHIRVQMTFRELTILTKELIQEGL